MQNMEPGWGVLAVERHVGGGEIDLAFGQLFDPGFRADGVIRNRYNRGLKPHAIEGSGERSAGRMKRDASFRPSGSGNAGGARRAMFDRAQQPVDNLAGKDDGNAG